MKRNCEHYEPKRVRIEEGFYLRVSILEDNPMPEYEDPWEGERVTYPPTNPLSSKKMGYDLGGSEGPVNPRTHTIVDIARPITEVGNPEYVLRDLRSKNWNLPPRKSVRAHRVLRYIESRNRDPITIELEGNEGVPKPTPGREIVYKNFAKNIHQSLLPGGRVHLFDHPGFTEEVAKHLRGMGYKDFGSREVNPPDPDDPEGYPAEHLHILQKPK